MHAFCIIGTIEEIRTSYIQKQIAELKINAIDQILLDPKEEETSIGIAQVKDWQKLLYLRPVVSQMHAGIIYKAEMLTTEAQNALLKIVEEPSPSTVIYISCPSETSLLPTIFSRCQIIHVKGIPTVTPTVDDAFIKTLRVLMDASTPIGKKMQEIDVEVKDKESAKRWITTMIIVVKNHKEQFPHNEYSRFQQALFLAQQQLQGNVSYKMVLDHIFLPKID